MALDFPSSPALNDTYTDSGKTWRWNGTGWEVASNVISGNIDNTATGYFDLPSGTTAQRPGSPNTGMIRYNTTLGCLESYVQSAWQVVANTTLDYGLITSAAGTTFDYGALS
jgi:hypothetical protein